MVDHKDPTKLAAYGHDLWQQDCVEKAESMYREALRLATSDTLALADYHGEFAAVLDSLGKRDEAELHLRTALRLEIERAPDPHDVGVLIARYFLAEFLVGHGHPHGALAIVQPHIRAATHGVWLLHLIETAAWSAVGDTVAAEQAARHTLASAPSDDKRSELRLRFLEIGLHDVAG